MNKKHQPFNTYYGGYPCKLVHRSIEEALFINQETIITKQEAMDFFGLMEKPEPKKPIHADLIEAFANGAELEYRCASWRESTWKPFPNTITNCHAKNAFLSAEHNKDWSFRIKPE